MKRKKYTDRRDKNVAISAMRWSSNAGAVHPLINICNDIANNQKNLSLSSMYGIKHILLRKFSAAFLMALLLGIFAIQLLHRHSHEAAFSLNIDKSEFAHLSKAEPGLCDICQFEFTREAWLPDTDMGIRPLAVFSVFKSVLNASFYTAPAFFSSHRGPPIA